MNAHPNLSASAMIVEKSMLGDQIYLVDDNSDMRRALNILGRVADVRPMAFASAAQFLQELPLLEPAPVLLNITISPMDCFRLLRALAVLETRWPVIAMVGPGEMAVGKAALNFGPIIDLPKPFSADDLKLAVRRALGVMAEDGSDSPPDTAVTKARNIAKQKAAEDEVGKFRRALGPFVVAAEATRMPMAFTNAAAPGNPLVFANDSFLALTGYTYDDVVGQSFDFLMSGMADPGAIKRIAAQFEQEKTETIEVECRRRDGHAFLAAIRINPVHDRNGATVQHCISFVSLSDHVERVRKEREALHALYQHTPDFIVTMEGPEHRFTFINDAYRRLMGNKMVIGEPFAAALPEVVNRGFVALLDRVYATGEPFTGKGMPITRDGETGPEIRFIDFIYQAVRGGSGTVTGVFCEGHDATEQKLATEQVQPLQADLIKATRASAMGTMAGTLAHELNQPLAAILNYVGACSRLIDLDGPNASQFASAMSGITAGARRAGEIIRRLRDMSEQRAVHREVFDLKVAIRESIELVEAGAWARVPIDDSDCSSIDLEADHVQIEQVIMNLVRNACEAVAGSDCGRVTVSTSVLGHNAVVSVQDNGPGISTKATARLFAHAPSAKPQGMGIGLSICRTIIEAHGGTIWLESGNGGANFCFSLPVIG